jgi:hypothetical protein
MYLYSAPCTSITSCLSHLDIGHANSCETPFHHEFLYKAILYWLRNYRDANHIKWLANTGADESGAPTLIVGVQWLVNVRLMEISCSFKAAERHIYPDLYNSEPQPSPSK